MKKSTLISLLATSLCCSEGNALVDIALPTAASLIASQSHAAFSPATTFAQSTIATSSISMADSLSLPQMAGPDSFTDVAHFALDFSGLLSNPSRLMMRLSALGSSSLDIAETIPLTTEPPSSPLVEAEVLTDMAHVALDFSGLLSPSKSMMRLYSIIGRLFALSADYLPDHTVHPEELMIQLFLICVTMRELIQEKPIKS
ncbi:unnamed protein product [Cylindrotheca closterium]|uniref:Uncharacterized protein n=1 Tax=Cylindrotheca closterium TaxID=2856 RepID=A0AAD2FNI5_9STRA|nr:unnamed protein product [Cylindrotheca closterium]